LYDQNIIKVEQPQYLLSIAYKWVGEKKVHCIALPDFSLYKKEPHNDRELVTAFWKILDSCDVAIGHNSVQFDTKMVQAAFMRHHLPPPAPFKQIDTKTVAKKYGRFLSNKLDDLGQEFQIGKKLEHEGWPLWYGCYQGDVKCWKKMIRYNKQDVALTERLYLELRPWMNNHPNMGVLDGRPLACKNCSSQKLHQHTKKTLAGQGWRYQYKCYACGAYQLGTKLHKFEEKLE
jgi:hypothetical protein